MSTFNMKIAFNLKRDFAFLTLAFIGLSALLVPQSLIAQKSNQQAIAYTIKPGDTLSQLTQKYVRPEISYRLIQKYNGIKNDRRLQVGATLYMPRQYLRFERSNAQILSIRGNISISNSGSTKTYNVGDKISEGAVITTGKSSFMALALEDGSQVSLPSNSNVSLRRLRRYTLERAIDYDFDIRKGGSRTKVAPLRGTNDRFRVRTPKAISAVRGTEFQMRHDDETGSAISEVVEGSLSVTNIVNNANGLLPAGNGLAVSKTGKEIREKLLPAPTVIDASKLQKSEQINFQINPLDGAAKYRIALASDATFLNQVEDIIIDNESLSLPALDNGRYFIRASALSSNGIEGLSNLYSFKRRLNSVSATVDNSEDGFSFLWSAAGEGKRNYHFQLFKADSNGQPAETIAYVDEAGLTNSNITISTIPTGEYVWRIGTVLFADGEVDTSWTDYQKISIGAE